MCTVFVNVFALTCLQTNKIQLFQGFFSKPSTSAPWRGYGTKKDSLNSSYRSKVPFVKVTTCGQRFRTGFLWLHVVTFNKDTLERQGEFTLSFVVPYPLQGAHAGERIRASTVNVDRHWTFRRTSQPWSCVQLQWSASIVELCLNLF